MRFLATRPPFVRPPTTSLYDGQIKKRGLKAVLSSLGSIQGQKPRYSNRKPRTYEGPFGLRPPFIGGGYLTSSLLFDCVNIRRRGGVRSVRRPYVAVVVHGGNGGTVET
ncbi:hypothetical protein ES288_A03G089600v1 [Gossypium darwinii]|uniref:Uncharacterized protein n=1 Tax=Gossypium darwinii TaxID=34276 RepID=A0A5D2H4H6_GOSDA|nr:hypothetical protein ES288_A03G089600v1 [Gossypium darwinii]